MPILVMATCLLLGLKTSHFFPFLAVIRLLAALSNLGPLEVEVATKVLIGTGALKGPSRAYDLGTWGAQVRAYLVMVGFR